MSRFNYHSGDWFGKVSAAIVPGFLLSLALSGCLAHYLIGGVSRYSVQHQFTMWSIAPLWVTILGFCFLFRSGISAWGWLSAANVVCWGLIYIPVML